MTPEAILGLLERVLCLDGYAAMHRRRPGVLVLDGQVVLTAEEERYVVEVWAQAKADPS